MPITIGTNIASLRVQGELTRTTARLGSVFERLSSGLRINHASDDAAGLAVGTALKVDALIKAQGIRNVNDGISLTNIATNATESLLDIVRRQSELAEQASNGTYTNTQREVMDQEFQALSEEYARIMATTTFNGISIFGTSPQTINIQAARSQIALVLPVVDVISQYSGDPFADSSGLLASWMLEDGSGTTIADTSGNGTDGSASNGVTWEDGQLGEGATLDGVDQYLSASDINFSGSAVTISFWMNESDYLTHGTIFESSTNFNGSTTGFGLFQSDPVTGGSNTLQLGIHGDDGFNIKIYTPPTPGWHHYVAVLDKSQDAANEVQFFIDGVLQTATSQAYSAENTNSFDTNPFYMFSRAGTSEFLAGSLDQVRLYNGALTSGEIQSLYTESSALSITTQSAASSAIDFLEGIRTTLEQAIGSLGASQSRFDVAVQNLEAQRLASVAAYGRIMDADVASDLATLIREKTLQQAGAMALAHANLEPAIVLKLLDAS